MPENNRKNQITPCAGLPGDQPGEIERIASEGPGLQPRSGDGRHHRLGEIEQITSEGSVDPDNHRKPPNRADHPVAQVAQVPSPDPPGVGQPGQLVEGRLNDPSDLARPPCASRVPEDVPERGGQGGTAFSQFGLGICGPITSVPDDGRSERGADLAERGVIGDGGRGEREDRSGPCCPGVQPEPIPGVAVGRPPLEPPAKCHQNDHIDIGNWKSDQSNIAHDREFPHQMLMDLAVDSTQADGPRRECYSGGAGQAGEPDPKVVVEKGEDPGILAEPQELADELDRKRRRISPGGPLEPPKPETGADELARQVADQDERMGEKVGAGHYGSSPTSRRDFPVPDGPAPPRDPIKTRTGRQIGFPLLIATTPRAGSHNHLNLLPAGEPLPAGFNPGDYLGPAAETRVGPDYLSAVSLVEQVGVTRQGREVLALVGIRVPIGPARDAISTWLQRRLKDLGREIAGIDWSRHDGSDYQLPVLADWQREAKAKFGLVPARKARKAGPFRWRMLLALAAGAAALVAVGRPVGDPALAPATSADPQTKIKADINGQRGVPRTARTDPWDEMLDAYFKNREEREQGEKTLVNRMGHALNHLGSDPALPVNFDKRDFESQRKWVREESSAFAKWLSRNYTPGTRPPFDPYVDNVDPVVVAEIGGEWQPFPAEWSVAETRVLTRRFRAVYQFLGKCRELRAVTFDDEIQRKSLGLLRWHEVLCKAPAPDEPYELPFLNSKELIKYKLLNKYLMTLSKAISDDGLYKAKQCFSAANIGEFANHCESILEDWKAERGTDLAKAVRLYGGTKLEHRARARELLVRIKNFAGEISNNKHRK